MARQGLTEVGVSRVAALVRMVADGERVRDEIDRNLTDRKADTDQNRELVVLLRENDYVEAADHLERCLSD